MENTSNFYILINIYKEKKIDVELFLNDSIFVSP